MIKHLTINVYIQKIANKIILHYTVTMMQNSTYAPRDSALLVYYKNGPIGYTMLMFEAMVSRQGNYELSA